MPPDGKEEGMNLPSQAFPLLCAGALVLAAGCGGRTDSVPTSDAGAGGASDARDASPSPVCAARAFEVREALPSTFSQNPLDPLGYMPFAEDGCGLVYVTKTGRLTRLAFDTGEREELEPSFAASRPSARDGTLAWEAIDANGRGVVRVRVGAAPPITVPGTYSKAFEPRVGPDGVVFTFTNGNPTREDADMDVAVYTPSTGVVTVVAEGPGQQRFGAIARGHVAYTDFAEDPKGAFSLTETRIADVVVVDRATRAATRRAAPGKQAFPLLDDEGFLLYTDFGEIHPEPKFNAYAFKLGKANDPVANDRVVHEGSKISSSIPWVQPSLAHGFVSWIESDQKLLRRATSLAEAPRTVATVQGGFIGVVDGNLAAFVAARTSGTGGIYVEARETGRR